MLRKWNPKPTEPPGADHRSAQRYSVDRAGPTRPIRSPPDQVPALEHAAARAVVPRVRASRSATTCPLIYERRPHPDRLAAPEAGCQGHATPGDLCTGERSDHQHATAHLPRRYLLRRGQRKRSGEYPATAVASGWALSLQHVVTRLACLLVPSDAQVAGTIGQAIQRRPFDPHRFLGSVSLRRG